MITAKFHPEIILAQTCRITQKIRENSQIFAVFQHSFFAFLERFIRGRAARGEKVRTVYSLIFIFSPALKITKPARSPPVQSIQRVVLIFTVLALTVSNVT